MQVAYLFSPAQLDSVASGGPLFTRATHPTISQTFLCVSSFLLKKKEEKEGGMKKEMEKKEEKDMHTRSSPFSSSVPIVTIVLPHCLTLPLLVYFTKKKERKTRKITRKRRTKSARCLPFSITVADVAVVVLLSLSSELYYKWH